MALVSLILAANSVRVGLYLLDLDGEGASEAPADIGGYILFAIAGAFIVVSMIAVGYARRILSRQDVNDA